MRKRKKLSTTEVQEDEMLGRYESEITYECQTMLRKFPQIIQGKWKAFQAFIRKATERVVAYQKRDK